MLRQPPPALCPDDEVLGRSLVLDGTGHVMSPFFRLRLYPSALRFFGVLFQPHTPEDRGNALAVPALS